MAKVGGVVRVQRLAVLSDQALFRELVSQHLRLHAADHVAQYADAAALFADARATPPQVVVVDLDHARDDVPRLVSSIRATLPNTSVVVVGTALRQSAAGAKAPLRSVETPEADARALVDAALVAHGVGGSPLLKLTRQQWAAVTPRQRDVLRWIATGADNETIARHLGIGVRAVKAHVTQLLSHFELENRTQLALLADHAGFQPLRQRAA